MSDKYDINLTGVKQNQGMWLVKVPKFLSRQWEKAAKIGEVGKITIEKSQGKPEVRFRLSEELTALDGEGQSDASLQVPRDYPLTMHAVGGQTLAVFSQSSSDGLSVEGMVVHRAKCRPVVTENYIKLKKVQIQKSQKPRRQSQQLDKAVTTGFKPVANHNFNVDYEKKKKSDGRMVRAERQVVLDMLFSAFERHQYYNLKELVELTQQPAGYLKEIMREIGIYINRGAHKSTWELKPEYQHHHSGEKEEEKEEKEMQTN